MRIRLAAAGALVAGTLAFAAPAHAAPTTLYGLGAGSNANTLFAFAPNAPGTITATVPVTGLSGQTLLGIDYRPLTGALYGVAASTAGGAVNTNTLSTFIINPATGAATLVGSATVNSISGASAFGVDFNPTVDRIRVVNNLASDGAGGNANNFRLNPDTGALVLIDADLDFTGLPGGNANAPEVAIAYDNNFAGAATTVLRGVTSGGDRVVINGGAGPGFPTLQNVGLLTADTSNNAGFDIDGETGAAYAILDVGGVSGLYTISLSSGLATLVGTIGTGTVDFGGITIPTVLPTIAFASAGIPVAEGDTAEVTVTRTGPVNVASTVDYTTELVSSASEADFTPTSGTLSFPVGVGSQTISVPTVEDGADEPDETLQVRLSNPSAANLATDPATTLNILDDDAPADPKDAVPPVGLISVPTQKIDRSIKASFACDDACAAQLKLKLGKKTLDTENQTLVDSGVLKVTFSLSAKEVKLVKEKAEGNRSATLRVLGSFVDAQGASSSTAKFQLG